MVVYCLKRLDEQAFQQYNVSVELGVVYLRLKIYVHIMSSAFVVCIYQLFYVIHQIRDYTSLHI